MKSKQIRVLIIDDSALVRTLLTRILQSDPEIEVVGTATDPYIARKKINKLKPDVLTLDIVMPKMDGITFLRNLMRLHPMPVVMLSCLTEKGADIAMHALELGAVDFVGKPDSDLSHNMEQYKDIIISKVKAAATARLRASSATPAATRTYGTALTGAAPDKKHVVLNSASTIDFIVAIGASTGGTEAIKSLLATLPPDSPGIVITQHIPAAFSAHFAETMNEVSALEVCQAYDGQPVQRGYAYIAPGGRHLLVIRENNRYFCKLSDEPPVNRHKPSVDVLFSSVSDSAGANAIGVLLTGMGKDGARGLKEMQQAGALTIAQDKNSSVIWGMPGAAVKMGAADRVLSLSSIPNALITHESPGNVLKQV